jgi:hypothetical protein
VIPKPLTGNSNWVAALTLLIVALATSGSGCKYAHAPFCVPRCPTIAERPLEPALSQKFVRWCAQWMFFNAGKSFNQTFWSPRRLGDLECINTYVWPPVVKSGSTVLVGVSLIWINKLDPVLSFRQTKINFSVLKEPLGLRIADFEIVGDPGGLGTSRFIRGVVKATSSSKNLSDNEHAIAEYKQGINTADDNVAANCFNAALKTNPNFALAYDAGGCARHRLGDQKGGDEDFEKAIRLNPSFAIAYFHRGMFQPDCRVAIQDLTSVLK